MLTERRGDGGQASAADEESVFASRKGKVHQYRDLSS